MAGNLASSQYSYDPTSTAVGGGNGFNWSSILGPAGNLFSGLMAGQGTENATNSQNNAINNMIGQQGNVLSNIENLYNPQYMTGVGANVGLQSLLNPGQASNYLQSLPGFQFTLGMGDQAINRQASANGGAYTPNNQAYLSQYNQGLANTTYGSYVNQLMQAAGLGSQANAGLTGANLTTGNNIGQGLVTQGQNSAAGALSGAGIGQSLVGAGGNLLSSILNNSPTATSFLNNLFGNGSGTQVSNAINNVNASGFDPNNTMGNFNYIGGNNDYSTLYGNNNSNSSGLISDPSAFNYQDSTPPPG